MRALPLAAALLLAAAPAAAPAQAGPVDPGRSRAEAQAPVLAPGAWGAAPLVGEVSTTGALALRASAGSITTGNAVYDGLIRQVVGGTMSLDAPPGRVVFDRGITRRVETIATIRAGKAVARVPLTLRMIRGPQGTTVRTFFSVPLGPYGVITATGGPPGSLRVAVTAFAPGP